MQEYKRISQLIAQLRDSDKDVLRNATKELVQIGRDAIPALIEALKNQDKRIFTNATNVLAEIGEDAVPGLIQALQDRVENVRVYAAWALALTEFETSAEYAVPRLILALGDRNTKVRIFSASALGKIGTPKAIKTLEEFTPSLIHALKNKDSIIREYAAFIFGEIKIETELVVPALIKALRDKDENVRHIVIWSLVKIGKEAIPNLKEALKNRYIAIRTNAATVLGKIGTKDTIPALIQAVYSKHSKNSAVRASVEAALVEIGKDAVPGLIQALHNSDPNARPSVARALGKIYTPEALKAIKEYQQTLIQALQGPNLYVRGIAIKALENIGKAAPALIQALQDPDPYARQNAAKALAIIGEGTEDTVSILIQALYDKNSYVRQSAAEGLAMIGEEVIDTVPALIQVLLAQDENAGEYAAWVLGEIGSLDAIPALIQALQNKNEFVDGGAVSEMTDMIRLGLQDPHPNVSASSGAALKSIGTPEALKAVKELQQSLIQALQGPNLYVRQRAAKALGLIKAEDAVPALIQTLQDPSLGIRWTAIVALKSINTPEALKALKERE